MKSHLYDKSNAASSVTRDHRLELWFKTASNCQDIFHLFCKRCNFL